MRLSKSRIIRWISGAYIAIFRSTPMLVQLYIIYLGVFSFIEVPKMTIFGFLRLDLFIPSVVALALNSSAYVQARPRPPALWACPPGSPCVW